MQPDTGIQRSLCDAIFIGSLLVVSSGCQTWGAATIPGLTLDKADRQIISRAEKDPFPSPSQVGIQGTATE